MLEKLRQALGDRYVIDREIGAGGMATVYLAHDIRHDRNVALKILKPELGAVLGPERFLSEIRVTAKLQHSNLLPLFDSGECEGQLYYVMPFVEGESLRALLRRERQLPVREAVHIAVAIANALDYAHRHGVIHRDLKPENILLQDRQPLIADFGIALAVSNAGGERVTQTGLSLGTPQYMSPEQATGERLVDGRTDIYSLGAVLYEMLTGEPPHHGATVQAIIARVITDTPQRTRVVRPSIPEHVDAAVAKALEKIPADRFDTAREFADVLEGHKSIGTDHGVVAFPSGAKASARGRGSRGPWLVAAGASLLAMAALAFASRQSRTRASGENAQPVSFMISPTGNEEIEPAGMALSADGRNVAYVGLENGSRLLFLRNLGDVVARPLPGTEGAQYPFFSDDGKWIGFFAAGELKRVALAGGAVFSVAKDIMPRWSRWLADNRILIETRAITRRRSGLSEISLLSGAIKPVVLSDTVRQENLALPVLLDDGRTLLFRSEGPAGIEDDYLAIATLGKPGHTVLDFLIANPMAYVDGHVITARWDGIKSMLLAVPVDLDERRIVGDPISLLDAGIATQYGAALSASGTLAYTTGDVVSRMVRSGGARGAGARLDTLLADARGYMAPRLSPDGRSVVYWLPGATDADVWLYDIADRTLTRFATRGRSPEWSSDGKRIIYIRPSTAEAGIWVQSVDGRSSEGARLLRPKLPPGAGLPNSAVFAPDDRTVVFGTYVGTQGRNIYMFTDGSADSARVWLATEFDEYAPRVSPDGKWIAYASNESGRGEVSVRPFAGPGPRVQISSGGGTEPVWSADGGRLYYRSGLQLVAADLSVSGRTLSVSSRRPVLTFSNAQSTGAGYDVARDDRVVYPNAAGGGTKLVVVMNWLSDVRRQLRR